MNSRLTISRCMPLLMVAFIVCACAATSAERNDTHSFNWGSTWWGMTRDEFLSRYPDASFAQGEAWIALADVESDARLRGLIAPGSRIRFWFDNRETGYALRHISFITPNGYDETIISLRQEFGRQISGEDTEASCFEADGTRRAYDPSGVGHVLALCMGAARFADRTRQNCVDVGGAGASAPYLQAQSDHAFQFVEMSAIDTCG